MNDQCEYHVNLVADIAVIKSDLVYIKERVCTHISDGESRGGFRDRLIILEEEVKAFKRIAWTRLIVASLIGGLVANATPEVFQWLIKLLVH